MQLGYNAEVMCSCRLQSTFCSSAYEFLLSDQSSSHAAPEVLSANDISRLSLNFTMFASRFAVETAFSFSNTLSSDMGIVESLVPI